MRSISPISLRRAAEYHVERHPVTEKKLTEVLHRKVAAHVRKKGIEAPPEVGAWIAEVVSALASAGLVDDRRLATARIRTMRRQGKSARAVEFSLRRKGVPTGVIADLAQAPESEDGAPTTAAAAEEDAARTLARRKKLGPHRPEDERREYRQKDLATLARAGFPFGLARRIVDGSIEEDPF